MAEQEVAKHVKKTYAIWTSPEHSFWHKVKEFLIEIFIIVFAITLSIWFHDNSEHQHEQKEVKTFLRGLKNDLTHDIAEMEADKLTYLKTRAAFKYISSVKLHQTLNTDSLTKHQNYILNTTGLLPNNGRFEGFKSAGKLGNIENITLQNNILDFYQEDVPSLLLSSNSYTERKKDLFHFINQNQKRISDSTTNLNVILASDEAQNLVQQLFFTDEVIYRYDLCIAKAKKIVAEIEKEDEEHE